MIKCSKCNAAIAGGWEHKYKKKFYHIVCLRQTIHNEKSNGEKEKEEEEARSESPQGNEEA